MPILSYAILILMLLNLAACGPIQFSKKSDTPENVVTNNGTNTNGATRDVHYSNTITAADSKLDVVLIIDDSSSMLTDNQKLGAKLATFVSTLQNSNIDWQMCATVTRPLTVNGTASWGASIFWQNYTPASGTARWILKPTSGQNLSNIFNTTMTYIGAGYVDSDDERAIKSAYWHVYNGDYHYATASGCYRSDAALAYVIISDEDERSIGGTQSLAYYESEKNKPLQTDDLPDTLIATIKSTFGATKKFTVNSIIVKPNDTACMSAQDSSGSKSHYGNTYADLSTKTGGGIGSICDVDYSANMNLIADIIQTSLSSVLLECSPVGDIAINIFPAQAGVSSRVTGSTVTFTPAISAGHSLNINYKCYQ